MMNKVEDAAMDFVGEILEESTIDELVPPEASMKRLIISLIRKDPGAYLIGLASVDRIALNSFIVYAMQCLPGEHRENLVIWVALALDEADKDGLDNQRARKYIEKVMEIKRLEDATEINSKKIHQAKEKLNKI